MRTLPVAPFKVLDAPNLRDDYYCSILAFDSISQTLAVGLGTRLYSWSESTGVQTLEDNGPSETSWLTTLDFSSVEGKKCILAYGRSNGQLNLMSLKDAPTLHERQYPRFRFAPHVQEAPVACVSWKPTCTKRPSVNPLNPGPEVENEDLLVGDEQGNIFYYAVEWPPCQETFRNNWRGCVQCLAYITVHTQQICGLSWSPDGSLFATGGNDNLCFLFETNAVNKTEAAPSATIESGEAMHTMLSTFREPMPPPRFNLRRMSQDSTWMAGLLGNAAPRSLTPPIDVSTLGHRQISTSTASSSEGPVDTRDTDDQLSRISTALLFARFFHPGSNTRLWDLNHIMTERAQARYPPSLPASVPVASEGFRHPISDTSGDPRTINERQAKHR